MPEEITPEPTEAQAFNAATATDDELRAEFNRVGTRGAELMAKAELSTEETTELTELSASFGSLQSELDGRAARQAETEAARNTFATFQPLTAPVAQETAPEAPQAPATPAPAQETATVPSVAQMAVQPSRPQMPSAPAEEQPSKYDKIRLVFSTDAAGVMRKSVGDDTTTDELTDAAMRIFGQFGTQRPGGPGVKADRSLGQLQREREFRLTGDRRADNKLLREARNERRLDGGGLLKAWQQGIDKGNSLTAAAGWCAPSEIRYDLCSLWERDGFIDLPTVGAPRGGISYTKDYLWRQIMDAGLTSFTKLTEAQVIADTPKNCTELPCPTFTERRMDVAATCITGSFLQDVGYPENVSNLIDGLLLKHENEIDRDLIAQIVVQAGAAVLIPPQGAGGAGTTADTSAVASILAAVDIAATDMRYREKMAFTRTLEIVLPQWVVVQWRADISRRNGYYTDPFSSVNDAEIARWFAVRNIRPQFVRNWQDAQSGLATGPGDITAPITPITALPTTVQFLLYPAGAIVVMREDVVTLTNVYDSTNLKQNLYTALFTEEGYAPIYPCGEVKLYTAQACPSGATAHQVYSSCAPAAA